MRKTLAQKVAPLAVLLCLAAAPLRAPAEQVKAGTEQSEPPPAPLAPVEEPKPEPEPARLAQPVELPKAALPTKPERPWRPYRAAAWTSFGLTLSLVTVGTVLGVLAQRRSDELGRITGIVEEGQPPIYDAARRLEFESLKSEGLSYNRGTIACFFLAGVTAITSGLLFWDTAKRAPKEERVALSIGMSAQGGSLVVAGRF